MKVSPRRSRCQAQDLLILDPGPLHHQCSQGQELFVKDVNYIVHDGDAVIVDEFTGRVMLVDGVTASTRRLKPKPCRFRPKLRLRLNYLPELLLLYPRLAGMTGTAKTEEVEFEKTYKSNPIVPTNRVRARQDWPDQVYKRSGQMAGVAKNGRDSQPGRPVLVGTTSVEKSELQFPFG